jgi:hypothetical protein
MKILANMLTVAAFVFLNGSTFVATTSEPDSGEFVTASHEVTVEIARA